MDLAAVCLPVATIRPEESPEEIFSYIDIGGIDSETNRIVDVKTVSGREAPSRARQQVRRGDILFSTVRPYLRKIARISEDYPNPVASTGFVVIRPVLGMSAEFLLYQVLSPEFLAAVQALQTGTSYPAVRASDVLEQTIVVPPRDVQEAIVAKLSTSLSALQRAKGASLRAQHRLAQYRTAVQYAALVGDLTLDWRQARGEGTGMPNSPVLRKLERVPQPSRATKKGEGQISLTFDAQQSAPGEPTYGMADLPVIPESWTWVQLASISEITSGISVSQNRRVLEPVEMPYLRVANVLRGRLDFTEVKTILVDRSRVEDYLLRVGDMLFTEGGDRDKLGRGWVWEGQLPQCLHQNHIFRARLIDPPVIDPKLVSHWGNTYGQEFFTTHGIQTTNLASINRAVLGQLPLPVPPSDEQRELLRRLSQRLAAAEKASARVAQQIDRARAARDLLLGDAFAGKLIPHTAAGKSASTLVLSAQAEREAAVAEINASRRNTRLQQRISKAAPMKKTSDASKSLAAAFERIGRRPEARRLFGEAGYTPEEVTKFYEVLRATPAIRTVFQDDVIGRRRPQAATPMVAVDAQPTGSFRLATLWLESFKNLKDYKIEFDVSYGLDVVLGWNGTGKSNLFEALVIIFRDLTDWVEKNRWPDERMRGYRLSYEVEDHLIAVEWEPAVMRRPKVTSAIRTKENGFGEPMAMARTQVILPRFVFGYYSGPTNRLAEHFLPMKQAHYARLRSAKADDAATLSGLLEQRRFFCAETHHAKYVLLAFSHKEDSKMSAFLRDRLRIVGFESALFIIRKPRWAKKGSKADDFWGATGIMRRVMERLQRYAIAPMVLKQHVSDGYRTTTEDHYYFLLPDLQSLHAFAAEYADARTFFLALESTDFSELIHDVKIQVSVKASETEVVSITFHQMSEGEQQLLMVLGLMRFTKSHQSLVLLDEPDTHLNPHWSIGYLKDLTRVMSDDAAEAPEQQTSQLLMATHDPLVIASLVKEQIHLLTRDPQTGACKWVPASINPRGLGFTGILTSEMFGFRSDLDEETLADLDNRVRLIAKPDTLSAADVSALEAVDKRLASAGFAKAFSDPYYAAFVRAWGRRYQDLMAGKQFLTTEQRQEVDRVATEVLAEAVAEVEEEDRS